MYTVEILLYHDMLVSRYFDKYLDGVGIKSNNLSTNVSTDLQSNFKDGLSLDEILL